MQVNPHILNLVFRYDRERIEVSTFLCDLGFKMPVSCLLRLLENLRGKIIGV